jgi:hypothetical protein
MPSIQSCGAKCRWQAWYRRNNRASTKGASIRKKGPEASGDPARRGGYGGITLSDVAIRSTRRESWGLLMQSLHVWHRLFNAEGIGGDWAGRGEISRRGS